MNNDLSDEAFWKWDEQNERQHWDKSFSEHALDGWQECRRRAQIQLEQERREAFEAACRILEHAIHDDDVSKWIEEAYYGWRLGQEK